MLRGREGELCHVPDSENGVTKPTLASPSGFQKLVSGVPMLAARPELCATMNPNYITPSAPLPHLPRFPEAGVWRADAGGAPGAACHDEPARNRRESASHLHADSHVWLLRPTRFSCQPFTNEHGCHTHNAKNSNHALTHKSHANTHSALRRASGLTGASTAATLQTCSPALSGARHPHTRTSCLNRASLLSPALRPFPRHMYARLVPQACRSRCSQLLLPTQ